MVLGQKQSGTVLEHDYRSFPWKAVCFGLQNVLTVQTDSGACGSIHCGLKMYSCPRPAISAMQVQGQSPRNVLPRPYLVVGGKVKTECGCDK